MLKVRYLFRFSLALLLLVILGNVVEATTLKVHYDVGWGNRITIRGNRSPFSWNSGVNATWTTGNIWVYSWSTSIGDVEVKPLINDNLWSTGANYRIRAGQTVDIYPFFGPARGSLERVYNFYSPQLGNTRTLIIYLPPSYSENRLKRYPVLYMHDGQNIFDAATSFGGVEWGVDETANRLIGEGSMEEIIVVGIYNTGPNRLYEYTTCCDPEYGGGGAESYSRFIIDTVKPFIDYNYRTLTSRQNTAIMGSSLGGLVSFHIARTRSDIFSKAASLSGSFWWNNEDLVNQVITETTRIPVKLYIDAGTNNDGLEETTDLRNALLDDGYVQGSDLYYYVAQDAYHSEASWAARLYIPLKYLFPAGSTIY
ncbi:MAG: alpha/beta hydrolase-fold protein [Acidobacteriota bacterium]